MYCSKLTKNTYKMFWINICIILLTVPSVESVEYDRTYAGLQEIPDGIPANTESIRLGRNELANADFSKLSGLPVLTTVHLRHNDLTSFPNLTVVGTTLEDIDLNSNMITHIPAALWMDSLYYEHLLFRVISFMYSLT